MIFYEYIMIKGSVRVVLLCVIFIIMRLIIVYEGIVCLLYHLVDNHMLILI